jgi:hypothetical protein
MEFFVINRPPNFEDMLNGEGRQYLQRCKDYSIQCLVKHLLLMVLGGIDIKDIKNIPLVCKFWNALFGTPEFWQPFVQRKLKDFPLCIQNASVYFNATTYLKYAFKWVFCNVISTKGDRISIGKLVMHVKNGQLLDIELPIDKQIRKRTLFLQSHVRSYTYKIRNPMEVTHLNYKTKESIEFNGKSNYKPEITKISQILPHGQGTWTFPDGSTFSGDDVACHGVPHGTGLWNGKEEVEFEFGKRVKKGHKRRKIEWE